MIRPVKNLRILGSADPVPGIDLKTCPTLEVELTNGERLLIELCERDGTCGLTITARSMGARPLAVLPQAANSIIVALPG